MLRIIFDEGIDGIQNLLSWFLRKSKGEYGVKKAQPDVAVGQFPAGALRNKNPRDTTSAGTKKKFR